MAGGWGRRRRKLKKVKPGDGSPITRYRRWHALTRSLFFLKVAGADGTSQTYAVDVDFFDFDHKAVLFRDGLQAATAEMPAAFEVPGGLIEVDASMYGLKYIRMVTPTGEERPLAAHQHSGEAMRARFGRRFPRVSRAIGIAAVIILLGSLAVAAPQIMAFATQFDVISDRIGTFTSPFTLPVEVNTAIGIAAFLAAVERALTLRSHWLIDFETWWLD